MEILRSLITNRSLIQEMVRRDLVGRYLGSAVGLFWAFINPLVNLAIYTIIFSTVLKVRLGADGGIYSFVEYLFCGLLPWITIQEVLSRSAGCVLENASLIQKMRFPTEILPINLAISGFIHQLIGTAIFFVVLLAAGDFSFRWIFLLPVAFALQLMLMVGLGWLVATVNVYYRDVGQLLGVALTIWFWLTPIVYPKEQAPEVFRIVLQCNPLTHLVEIYRAAILGAPMPSINSWVILLAFSVICFFIGLLVLERHKAEFPDLL
jgi:lipopolysaccharide transport system permease protein